uniref:Uncharacterized protein n=1 Tax=Meloidogyne enterolobii TaxID=390850 RepID=A0A6V7V9K0_MELEN|nr:unnamed protein product [Meloidogyne enterolobii]
MKHIHLHTFIFYLSFFFSAHIFKIFDLLFISFKYRYIFSYGQKDRVLSEKRYYSNNFLNILRYLFCLITF